MCISSKSDEEFMCFDVFEIEIFNLKITVESIYIFLNG